MVFFLDLKDESNGRMAYYLTHGLMTPDRYNTQHYENYIKAEGALKSDKAKSIQTLHEIMAELNDLERGFWQTQFSNLNRFLYANPAFLKQYGSSYPSAEEYCKVILNAGDFDTLLSQHPWIGVLESEQYRDIQTLFTIQKTIKTLNARSYPELEILLREDNKELMQRKAQIAAFDAIFDQFDKKVVDLCLLSSQSDEYDLDENPTILAFTALQQALNYQRLSFLNFTSTGPEFVKNCKQAIADAKSSKAFESLEDYNYFFISLVRILEYIDEKFFGFRLLKPKNKIENYIDNLDNTLTKSLKDQAGQDELDQFNDVLSTWEKNRDQLAAKLEKFDNSHPHPSHFFGKKAEAMENKRNALNSLSELCDELNRERTAYLSGDRSCDDFVEVCRDLLNSYKDSARISEQEAAKLDKILDSLGLDNLTSIKPSSTPKR